MLSCLANGLTLANWKWLWVGRGGKSLKLTMSQTRLSSHAQIFFPVDRDFHDGHCFALPKASI